MPDASQADTAEFSRGPVFNRVANYFAGQPFGNLLSFIVICAFGYYFWWMQTIGESQKVDQLQRAFAAIHAENSKTVVEVAAKEAEATKAVSENSAQANKYIAEKHADTVKLMLEHAEAAGKRREKEGERTEQFLREFVRPIPAPVRPAVGAKDKDDAVGHLAEKPDVSPSGTN